MLLAYQPPDNNFNAEFIVVSQQMVKSSDTQHTFPDALYVYVNLFCLEAAFDCVDGSV